MTESERTIWDRPLEGLANNDNPMGSISHCAHIFNPSQPYPDVTQAPAVPFGQLQYTRQPPGPYISLSQAQFAADQQFMNLPPPPEPVQQPVAYPYQPMIAGVYSHPQPQPQPQPSLRAYRQPQYPGQPLPGTYEQPQHSGQLIPGSWVGPQSRAQAVASGYGHIQQSAQQPLASQPSYANLQQPCPLPTFHKAPSHWILRRVKTGKGGIIKPDQGHLAVVASNYQGELEVRVARPAAPGRRAISRHVASHASTEFSSIHSYDPDFVSNSYDENSPVRNGRRASASSFDTNAYSKNSPGSGDERTPRASGFNGKKRGNVHGDVPTTMYRNPPPTEYRLGFRAEIRDRALEMKKQDSETRLVENGQKSKDRSYKQYEENKIVNERLKKQIMADLEDPHKQSKEERQRNHDLLRKPCFVETGVAHEKSRIERRLEQETWKMQSDRLNQRLAVVDAHAERLTRERHLKKRAANEQYLREDAAYEMTPKAEGKQQKEAQRNMDLVHLRNLNHLKQRLQTPRRGQAQEADDETPMARYKRPYIESPTDSNWSGDDDLEVTNPYDFVDVTKVSTNSADASEVSTSSRPSTSYSGDTAYSRGIHTASSVADAMINAQPLADAAEPFLSSNHPSALPSSFLSGILIGGSIAEAMSKAQSFAEGTAPYTLRSRPSTLNSENTNGLAGAMIKAHSFADDIKPSTIRSRPSTLFSGTSCGLLTTGSIADAMLKAESISREGPKPERYFTDEQIAEALVFTPKHKKAMQPGGFKPIDSLPRELSDHPVHPSNMGYDSLNNTPVQGRPIKTTWPVKEAAKPAVLLPTWIEANKADGSKQYVHTSGANTRTTYPESGSVQAEIVPMDYKAYRVSRVQQLSGPSPDESNVWHEVHHEFSTTTYVNLKTGKEEQGLPEGGIIKKDLKATNKKVDTAAYKSRSQHAREVKMSKSKTNLGLGGGFGGLKAVSDSGHNGHTTRDNTGVHVPTQSAGYLTVNGPHHNPYKQYTGPHRVVPGPHLQQQYGYGMQSYGGHHYPPGPHSVQTGPYGPAVASYSNGCTRSDMAQQYGYQQVQMGGYGTGMTASASGYGNGMSWQGGYQTPGSTGGSVGGGNGGGQQPQRYPVYACGIGPNYRNFTYQGPKPL